VLLGGSKTAMCSMVGCSLEVVLVVLLFVEGSWGVLYDLARG